jgi:hypothetical protein
LCLEFPLKSNKDLTTGLSQFFSDFCFVVYASSARSRKACSEDSGLIATG